MADLRTAWTEAGEQLSGLGLKLKLHYDQQREPDADTPQPQQQGDAQQADAQADVKDAVKRLGEAVQDAVDAMTAAARDQAVKEDVRQVGRSLKGALGVTFSEISDELGKAFNRGGQGSAGQSPWGSPESSTGPAAATGPTGTATTEAPGTSQTPLTPEEPGTTGTAADTDGDTPRGPQL
jgi:hypothetical protein